MSQTVEVKHLFYPRERNNRRNRAVKQAVRSRGKERRTQQAEAPGSGSNRPPGSRDRSNISCSSVWPDETSGVTYTERERIQGVISTHIQDIKTAKVLK